MKTFPLLQMLLLFCTSVSAQFAYTTNNGTITITGYTGAGGAVAIPETINGFTVTRIGDWVFSGNTSLTSVAIPNSVTNIGYPAFSSCANLNEITVDALNPAYRSVEGVLFNKSQTTLIQYPAGKTGSYTIPDYVISIGDWAFYDCTNLSVITIPEGASAIGNYAFAWCTSLITVFLPEGVVSIGYSAFSGCSSLSAITVDTLNPAYSSVDGVLFNKSQNTLIRYPCGKAGSYVIPSSVSSISDAAFQSCPSLASVTIPNSVISLGRFAFNH